MKIPSHLYKFRTIDARTLGMLDREEVYYAAPEDFNDPLDCDPTVGAVLDDPKFRAVIQNLCGIAGGDGPWDNVARKASMNAAANAGKRAIETGEDIHELLVDEYGKRVRAQLSAHFQGKGILSMAGSWQNVLMWSHYANEHSGICLGYDTAGHTCTDLRAVAYDKDRAIPFEDVHGWIVESDDAAEARLLSRFFFAKASSWDYEGEWRDVHDRIGVASMPFTFLSEVVFGLRCDDSLKKIIIEMFASAARPPQFFEMIPSGRSFALDRRSL